MGTANPPSTPILDLEISRELTLSRHIASARRSSCREWSCSRYCFLHDNELALFRGFSYELVVNLLVPFAPLGVDFSMSCRLKDSSEAGR